MDGNVMENYLTENLTDKIWKEMVENEKRLKRLKSEIKAIIIKWRKYKSKYRR